MNKLIKNDSHEVQKYLYCIDPYYMIVARSHGHSFTALLFLSTKLYAYPLLDLSSCWDLLVEY